MALRDPALRAVNLPPGYATGDVAPALLESTLKDLLARTERQARPRHVLGSMAERFVAEHPALMSGQHVTLRAAATLTLRSPRRGPAGTGLPVTRQAKRSNAAVQRRRIMLPAITAPALKFALDTPAFRVEQLPEIANGSGKVELIKRLMKEGAVVALADSEDSAHLDGHGLHYSAAGQCPDRLVDLPSYSATSGVSPCGRRELWIRVGLLL